MPPSRAATIDALHATLQSYIDRELLPCVATVILDGDTVVDSCRLGYQDFETRAPLREDAIFRVYSNTKALTTVLALRLVERGLLRLDTPVADCLPALADLTVLRAGATAIDQVEPAATPVTLHHLLTHTAGFGYGFIQPDSLPDAAYLTGGLNTVEGIDLPLDELVRRLATFPLAFQPGTGWRYGFATDVLAHLVEVVLGQRFDACLRQEIFAPLGMHSSGFALSVADAPRLAGLCAPRHPLKPLRGELRQIRAPGNSAIDPPNWLSGGGGLLMSLQDLTTFARLLRGGGAVDGVRLLSPASTALLFTDQLPPDFRLQFPMAPIGDCGFSCGFAIRRSLPADEPAAALGEAFWGGLAGSHLWFARNGLTGICVTQLMPSFWHPFSHDFRRLAYQLAAD
jgi:CubicO group peptidase (beta-lactamase class C family)